MSKNIIHHFFSSSSVLFAHEGFLSAIMRCSGTSLNRIWGDGCCKLMIAKGGPNSISERKAKTILSLFCITLRTSTFSPRSAHPSLALSLPLPHPSLLLSLSLSLSHSLVLSLSVSLSFSLSSLRLRLSVSVSHLYLSLIYQCSSPQCPVLTSVSHSDRRSLSDLLSPQCTYSDRDTDPFCLTR
jgi:hypothetical protein